MTLTARKPTIASDTALIDWSPVPEFAHINNGASAVIPYVEHYLNDVMNEVRNKYCEGIPALHEEIDQFIRQEGTHARYHLAFNRQMFVAGYEGLRPIIESAVADLRRLRKKRSLAFNLAYCAGFETTATFSCKYALEKCDDYFKGADSYGANLFQWHVAEEFEHRATVHKALYTVSVSYVNRLAGLIYSFWHINKTFSAAAKVILTKYRENMTSAERRRSLWVERRLIARQFVYLLPRMLRLLNPWYDPAALKVSDRVQRAMDFFKTRAPILASYADLRDENTG